MRKKYFFVMVLCFLSCFAKIFANEIDLQNSFESQFEKVSGDKYYIKLDSLFISDEAIFFHCQGQLIPVTLVESDENGVFIRSSSFAISTCPVCKWPLTPWGTCGNPNCPTKG